MSAVLERVVRAAGRRPGRVLVAVAVAAGIFAALALRLEPSTAVETLVTKNSDSYRATEVYRERFGDHAIVVLVRGDLADLVLTDNLGRLLGLEGCLSGNKPKGQPAPGGASSPCAEFARTKPVKVVYGPGTFINSAVGEINEQFARQLGNTQQRAERAKRAARRLAKAQGRDKAGQQQAAKAAEQLVYAEFTRNLLQLNVRYGLGLRGLPRIDDPDFVSALVFDPQRGANVPKARFAYLFPNRRSAVIQVRLEPDLSEAQRRRAIELVRDAVGMKQWRLKNGGSYVVTGAPVVVEDLAAALTDSLLRLLVVALLVMAVVLALVFRSRLRLLPLAVALAAVAITFGLMSLLGAPLTMASIAVLPVLLGLGVDYAIQYQARVEEEGDAARTARLAVPTIATACLATGVGFLVLLLSPVPMVRGFGILLVAGIAIAFFLALSAGTAALAATARRRGGGGRLGASARGAAELVDEWAARAGRALAPVRRLGGRARDATMRGALERPRRVLLIGLALALVGVAVDSQTRVSSDLRELVPNDLRGARDLDALQRATGVAGEIDVVVESRDLTDPKVVAWMRDYQGGLLKKYGYTSKNGCGRAELCPALSLPDLFRSEAAAKDQAAIRGLLAAVPPYFSQAVITADRKTATLAFGIKLMPLDEQQKVIDEMQRALDPPAGVTARLAGLQVLGAQANEALSSPPRRLGTLLAGLLAVGLALLLVSKAPRATGPWTGRWERAWVPLAPIALAAGWSALVLFVLRVPLNPMSATLSALVIAISTEFSVLLTARYREERAAGLAPAEALRRTYASTGAAVVASGATAIAGFAVLALSDVQMLSDFGRVTVVDLSVSLLGVLAVLPAVLMLAERRNAGAEPPAPPAAREESAVPA